MSNPNRRGAMALVSASLCLALAALFYFAEPAPSLTASAPVAVPAAADWGLSFPTEGASPVGNATAEELAQYDTYYLGDTSQKVLYLTFDCGYENGNTEAILDALKKHDAPAAFFVVGHMIESAPDIVRRMAEEGHIVGNHTYHHPDMSSISDLAAFQKELTDLETLYLETTGQPLSKFYRPPQGKYSVENLKQAQELEYTTVFWSLAYVDWNTDAQPSAEEAYANPETRYWAVVERTGGEVIGEIFVDDFSARNGWCELDWKIGSRFWQKGYATEAAAAVARHLLDAEGFHRIQAKCCVENPASERVMQKIGMTREGTLRGYFRTKDGRWCDVVLYALIDGEQPETAPQEAKRPFPPSPQ